VKKSLLLAICLLLLIALLLVVLCVAGCNSAQPATPPPTQTAPEPLTQTATIKSAAQPTPNISIEGQQALAKYKEYAIYGVTLDMPIADMQEILGPLNGLEASGGAETNYQYENAVFVEYPSRPKVVMIEVGNGCYMGLTIGESTVADVQNAFHNLLGGNYTEDPDYGGRIGVISEENPDLSVSCLFKDEILVKIFVDSLRRSEY
jgi:hypothetical protein